MGKNNTNDRNSLIEEIKRRLPLDNLLYLYNVKKGKSNNSYYCPFHEDKNPSFVASNEKGWKCLSSANCGSGDQISFIEKYERISFDEALIKASDIANVEIAKQKGQIVLDPLQDKHLNYLLNRGIKKEIAHIFNLKSKEDYVLFPQKREDKITGWKAINIINKKMFFQGKDTKSKLFPDYDFRGYRNIIFCAGEYDCIYLTQKLIESNLNDYKAVTSSTGEGNFPKDLNRLLEFPEIENFMIFYDHDEMGRNGAIKLAHELNKMKKLVEIYSFPKDKKEKYDVSDFFNEGNSIEDLFNLEKTTYTFEEEKLKDTLEFKRLSLDSIDNFHFETPNDYYINENGVEKITVTAREEKVEVISMLPILITKQAINTDYDVVSLEIAFKRDFVWKKIIVERETICDSKKILELCNSGFPVNSDNVKKVIKYLHSFEVANLQNMETIYLTHNNGWKDFKNKKGFGLGKNILGLDAKEDNISFTPENGFEKFSKALVENGSFEEWTRVIKPLMSNPKVAFSVYASLAAPFLALLDCSSFLIHFWGDSSMGKTTVMEIAASVWGNPAKETGGLITSWNSTMVFVERMASFFNDLPMYLDDSQTADDKTISKIMYMIGNSTGRGRGKKSGGVDTTNSWHTICFTTGEKQLTESTQYDGAKARTIEFNGSPFGRNEGKTVHEVKTCVRENYGHIGNIFMHTMLNSLNQSEEYRKEFIEDTKSIYNELRNNLALISENEIGNRMAGYFAVIEVAAEYVESVFEFGGKPHEVIESCFLEAIKERKSEGDTSTRALNEVISFAQGNEKKFMGKSDDTIKEHFGIWRENEYIAFYPHKIKEFLSSHGFSPNSVMRSWANRDWVRKTNGENTNILRYAGNVYRMVVIKWEVMFGEHKSSPFP